ncbi:MAG: hypothetical protein ACE5FP_09975 [Gemmatimonadota bacterium]
MGGVKKTGLLAVVGLLVGTTALMGWTAVETSAVHEVKVVLGVPGQVGQTFKVIVSNEQLEDVMDGASIVVKVDGAEESELVAQISMKEQRKSGPRAFNDNGGGSGDSGW